MRGTIFGEKAIIRPQVAAMADILAPPKHTSEKLSRETIIGRVREGLLAARDDVVGIVIFGSFARAGEGQDVDVLVVLASSIASHAAWGQVMLQAVEAIQLPAVDVIPIDRAGLRLSLKAHRPLFMEIAFDGLVIYDGAQVADLLAESRREITAAGIRRTETGWQYPVKYRQASPLSPGLNNVRAGHWLVDARRDLEIAEQLQTTGYFDRSAYHSQQSIERSVKAVLICFGRFERVHWVGKKLREVLRQLDVGEWQRPLLALAQISLSRERDAILARYIDDEGEEISLPWERYDSAVATAALADAQAALATASDFIAWWFAEEPPVDDPG